MLPSSVGDMVHTFQESPPKNLSNLSRTLKGPDVHMKLGIFFCQNCAPSLSCQISERFVQC